MDKPVSGIYIFRSPDHRPLYIGYSTDVLQRQYEHITSLNNGYHDNRQMQADWPFEYYLEIYEECFGAYMAKKENELIHELKPIYNKSVIPLNGPNIDPDHFWSKVHIKRYHQCWSAKVLHQSGYGRMYFEGKQYAMHRIAYYLSHDEWPAGAMVRHLCNNPACCNPIHLQLGSAKENNNDPGGKMRQPRFSDEEVLEMISMYQKGFNIRDIGQQFDTQNSTVYNILSRKTKCYQHIIPTEFEFRDGQSKHPYCQENIDKLYDEHKPVVPKKTFATRLKCGWEIDAATNSPYGMGRRKPKIPYQRKNPKLTPEEQKIIEKNIEEATRSIMEAYAH